MMRVPRTSSLLRSKAWVSPPARSLRISARASARSVRVKSVVKRSTVGAAIVPPRARVLAAMFSPSCSCRGAKTRWAKSMSSPGALPISTALGLTKLRYSGSSVPIAAPVPSQSIGASKPTRSVSKALTGTVRTRAARLGASRLLNMLRLLIGDRNGADVLCCAFIGVEPNAVDIEPWGHQPAVGPASVPRVLCDAGFDLRVGQGLHRVAR